MVHGDSAKLVGEAGLRGCLRKTVKGANIEHSVKKVANALHILHSFIGGNCKREGRVPRHTYV